ncbi:MAG: hypothetical protein ACXWC6_03190 [Ramlibacter sp.]
MFEELDEGLIQLRRVYAQSKPAVRLAAIRLRLASAKEDSGPTRLITTVSAVEALARSLVVHAPGRPASTAHFRYQQVRQKTALELVEEVLRLYGAKPAADHFGEETYRCFALADQYRDLVVHECTYPGHEKSQQLIEACERVLDGMVSTAGLLRVVTPD